jgi:hypothetical protein
MRGPAVLAFLVAFSLVIKCEPSLAEEQPCRYSVDKSAVTCGTADFKKLVDAAVTARGDANTCAIRLTASEASASDCRAGLSACVGAIPPPPPPRPRWPSRVGYGLTAVGAVVAASAALPSPDPAGRVTLGLSGLLALATGYLFIDRE